ncbi:DUF342 domain-containing protein, partial [candidate division KSB1 bacterium]
EDAYKSIERKEITYGVDDELLKKIFRDKTYDKNIIFAKGEPPVPTRQGKKVYFFNTNPSLRPVENKKGKLDYKNIKLIQNVMTGDKVFEFIPPEEGKNGKTVLGNNIPVEELRKIELPVRNNIDEDPQERNVFIATIDGAVKKVENYIEVNETLVINKDIDYSTGNLESSAATIIEGDVKSGFTVDIKNDLEVNGTIEDSEVTATGGILVQREISGRGKKTVSAGGDILARGCQKMTLISKSDIIISERAADCTLIAEGKIIIQSKKSDVMRCRLIAGKGIEVRNIGSKNYDPVEVVLGMPAELYFERETLIKKINKLTTSFKEIDKSLKLANKMQVFGRSGNVQNEKIRDLQQDYTEMKRELDKANEEKEVMDTEIKHQEDTGAKLSVSNKIYPKVTINICNRKLAVAEEKSKVIFSAGEENIVERPF